MEKKNNTFALTLDSDAFGALKNDFNKILTGTLMNMEKRESESAELTVKLKITLRKDTAPDFSEVGYKAERDIVRPTFSHKISSVMQMKLEESGVLGGDYELVWDDDKCGYIIRPIDNGQTSIFDEQPQESEILLLTMDAADNYSDYEYKEPEEE